MLTLWRYSFRILPSTAAVLLALSIGSAVSGVLLTFLTGRVVGAAPAVLTDRADSIGMPAFVGLLAAMLGTFIVAGLAPVAMQMASKRLVFLLDRDHGTRISGPLLGPRRVGHLEDPVVQDEVQRARGKEFGVWVGIINLGFLVSAKLSAVGAAMLVGWLFSWWAATALFVANLIVERYFVRVVQEQWDAMAGELEASRRAQYVFDLTMREATKELRVFGLGHWMVDRYLREWRRAADAMSRARTRGIAMGAALLLLPVSILAAATVFAARSAEAGDLGLTQAATVIPALLQLGMSQSGFLVAEVTHGLKAYRAMVNLPQLIEERSGERAEIPTRAGDPPRRRKPPTVTFDSVSFRYPGTDRDVLTQVDLVLGSGEALALVGINGAGKSTLVKLLAGLHRPTSGQILIDGVDLQTLDATDLAAWQRRVAPIVQDFARFPMSVADNVRLGATELQAEQQVLDEIAVQAGIDDIVAKLPSGWNTLLDKSFDGGVDLSGGEWQRVALARALFAVRAGAGVLVLDEPAAALDVQSEARLVERYLQLTEGVTSLIISHRFSVVRDAHRIVVLDDGRITENGTHDELLEKNGKYATMFRLQAERYLEAENA